MTAQQEIVHQLVNDLARPMFTYRMANSKLRGVRKTDTSAYARSNRTQLSKATTEITKIICTAANDLENS